MEALDVPVAAAKAAAAVAHPGVGVSGGGTHGGGGPLLLLSAEQALPALEQLVLAGRCRSRAGLAHGHALNDEDFIARLSRNRLWNKYQRFKVYDFDTQVSDSQVY